jgi:hypothetical protein
LGGGLHPWEFYEYDLMEYMQRRKGRSKEQKYQYQQRLIAAMVPYMDKRDRVRTVNDAFKGIDNPSLSLKERYAKIKQRYIDAGILIEDGGKTN